MKHLPLVVFAASSLALLGCERQAPESTGTPPDNSGTNTRDRAGDTKTPMDQGQNEADIRITADVRKAIVDDKAMSVNAQNVKIITAGGVVTLRGPVENQAEKDAIEAKARAVAGVTNVVNELEVKTP